MVTQEADRPHITREHFNTTQALSRLLAGEPSEAVFGPLPKITERDLVPCAGSDVVQKVRRTMLTALFIDASIILVAMPLDPNLHSPATIPPEQTIEHLTLCLVTTCKETQEAVDKAANLKDTTSLLSRVQDSLGNKLDVDREKVNQMMMNRIVNLDAARIRLPKYYVLLFDLLRQDRNRYPTTEEMITLAESSLMIVTRPASIDFDYFLDDKFVTMEREKYDSELFELLKKPNGDEWAALKRATRAEIDEIYEPHNANIGTCCPANSSLTPAINIRTLKYFSRLEIAA